MLVAEAILEVEFCLEWDRSLSVGMIIQQSQTVGYKTRSFLHIKLTLAVFIIRKILIQLYKYVYTVGNGFGFLFLKADKL